MSHETTTPASDRVKKKLRLSKAAVDAVCETGASSPGTGSAPNDSKDPPDLEVTANQVWQLQFIQGDADGGEDIDFYRPSFTHQIFAEEKIRGYRNPRLLQIYDAATLHCYLRFSFDSVSQASAETTPVLSTLQKLLTDCGGYAMDWDTFQQRRRESPPREMEALRRIHSYAVGNQEYGIFEGSLFSSEKSLANDSFRALHRRAQFLTLLYIDAASFIDEDDPRWLIFLIRSLKDQSLVGYATVYRFPAIENIRNFEPNQERWRLAQLLILPPYQRAGHGTALFKTLYERAHAVLPEQGRRILEINVEDPSPAFCCMRDLVDLERLLTQDAETQGWARSITASHPVPANAELVRLARCTMMTMSQVRRLYEILRLAAIDREAADRASEKEELERAYRLTVKRRLYREQEECFGLKSDQERKQILSEMYESLVQENYRPVIQTAERRGLLPRTTAMTQSETGAAPRRPTVNGYSLAAAQLPV
jgi:histone acetyltransferase 1